MIRADCEKLVEDYFSWLRSKTEFRETNAHCEITTPFLDRHNDRLQIYVQKSNGHLTLTDDGYILSDLEMSGCKIESANRKQMLQTVLNGFGIDERDGELIAEATPENFPQKKHALIQAMLTVNDMFMTSTQRVATLFHEDVVQFLEAKEIRFTPNVVFQGKSGFPHRFDFVIPKSRKKPERVLKAINNPNKESATNLLFAWTDARDARPKNAIAYAILNDVEHKLNADIENAFSHYDVRMIRWTDREKHTDELAA